MSRPYTDHVSYVARDGTNMKIREYTDVTRGRWVRVNMIDGSETKITPSVAQKQITKERQSEVARNWRIDMSIVISNAGNVSERRFAYNALFNPGDGMIATVTVRHSKVNLKKDVTPTEDCPICMQKINQKEAKGCLQCSGVFHNKCINKWVKKSGNCPMCRCIL